MSETKFTAASRRDLLRLAAASACAFAGAHVLWRAPIHARRPIPAAEIVGRNGHRFLRLDTWPAASPTASSAPRANGAGPNGYILGQEAGGAFIGGLRYGEGTMYTRNAGQQRVLLAGPVARLRRRGDGDRTMMLVYNLPSGNRSIAASPASMAPPICRRVRGHRAHQ